MEVFDCIFNRVTTRKFKSDKVREDELKRIAECGTYAPTAMNAQALTFTVITDDGILAELNDSVKNSLASSDVARISGRDSENKFNFFYRAPALIVVSASNSAVFPREDAGCAMQNMYLASTALGLGACWINQLGNGNGEKPKVNAVLTKAGVPEGDCVYAALAVGYSDGEAQKKERVEKVII